MSRHHLKPNSSNADDLVSLARAIGLHGFGSQDASADPREDETDNQTDPVVTLARKIGLTGFARSTTPTDGPNGSGAEDIIALARSLGMQGVRAAEPGVAEVETSTDGLDGAAALPNLEANTAPPPVIQKPKAQLSRERFVIIEIPTGSEAAFKALETKMGMPFAGHNGDQPYWSAAALESGGRQRAFTFSAGQFHGFADLLGELGSTGLRLSVSRIELGNFKQSGPGATGWAAERGAPQLPQHLPQALRSALRRP